MIFKIIVELEVVVLDFVGLVFGGMLICNAIPHLVAGVQGETFYTPWAQPRGIGRSSPLQNFLWGSANLAAGIALTDHLFSRSGQSGPVAAGLGFIVMGAGLAIVFGRRNSR